jgi:hypothetical protein
LQTSITPRILQWEEKQDINIVPDSGFSGLSFRVWQAPAGAPTDQTFRPVGVSGKIQTIFPILCPREE